AIDMPADRVVEMQMPGLAQLHDAGGGEAFRMRGDAEAVARRQRLASVEIGGAEGLFKDDLALVADRDDTTRLLGFPHLEFQPARDVVERRRQPFGHRVAASPNRDRLCSD